MELRFSIPARITRSVAAVMLLCLLAGTVLSADAAKTVKLKKENKRMESREIEVLEESWRQALLKGDATLLEKMLGDDFLAISANGTLSDKQQYLKRLGSHANQFSRIDLMDTKVRVQQTSAVVTSQARVTGQLDGRPIDGVYRYTKVYGRTAGGPWRVLNFEATRVSGPHIDETDMHRGMPIEMNPHGR
ncbi:ketosteroid isomerase-like enzyme [Terriglobus roseus DSM 18391]|uniref:Ketosteroid isomerase-like enzyme n=1 Tax=Terriglobus roseus (strain DSM 18391 / NRRL B-41598 / KBS 63) TaxID=926566 RepID=I3ZBP6_TERRK|nr:nuclear transport factor 2 family protein [Terriglobus roseus]AFL86664.1 ketosteroid isomerase-like enzyme [Terriglobus roseus DSM 18391]